MTIEPSTLHLIIELFTGFAFAEIGTAALRLQRIVKARVGPGAEISEAVWLTLFSFTMALLNWSHAILAVSNVPASLDDFIPVTWLVGKLLYVPFIMAIAISLNKPKPYISFTLPILLITVIYLLGPVEYGASGEGTLGRPLELIPAIMALSGLVELWRRETLPRHKWIAFSLVAFLIAQLIMVFSSRLFDDPFMVAHWVQLLAALLFVPYGVVFSESVSATLHKINTQRVINGRLR